MVLDTKNLYVDTNLKFKLDCDMLRMIVNNFRLQNLYGLSKNIKWNLKKSLVINHNLKLYITVGLEFQLSTCS